MDVTGKSLNLNQLLLELAAAGVSMPHGLGRTANDLHTYDAAGAALTDLGAPAITVVNAHVPSTALHDAVVAAAVSAVGITLANLTQAQRLALVACLLYRAGGLDPATLAVQPLEQWITR